MRYRPGHRLPEKDDRSHILRKEIKNPASKMALKQAILPDFLPIYLEEGGPVGRRHYLSNRVLIAEEEAQRHAGGLRNVQIKDARTQRRPNSLIGHRPMIAVRCRSRACNKGLLAPMRWSATVTIFAQSCGLADKVDPIKHSLRFRPSSPLGRPDSDRLRLPGRS